MFDNLTDPTKNTIMVATLVGVLVLLYLEARRAGWGVSVSRQQFTGSSTYGSSQKHSAARSDVVGDFDPRGGSVSAEAQALREGMGAYEAPVFWNAGSFAQVGAHHQATAGTGVAAHYNDESVAGNFYGQDAVVSNTLGQATEGMLGRPEPNYTERMSVSKLNPY